MLKWFENDMNKAISISLLAHLTLLILFMAIKTSLVLPTPEYAEISFSSTSSVQQLQRIPQENEPPTSEPLAQQTQPLDPTSEPPIETESTETPQTDPVALPKMRNSFDDMEPTVQRDMGKITPSSQPVKPNDVESVYNRRADAIPATTPDQIRDVSASGQQAAGTETVPSPVSRQGLEPGKPDQNFTIEGEAARRSLLHKVIPQYPPGLQNEAVIKIRITVLPNGEIGQMLPVLKGDPELEAITLRALRQWQFNSIAPGQEQRPVTGIVTFRFELR